MDKTANIKSVSPDPQTHTLLAKITGKLRFLIEYYLICRSDPIRYLRRQGMRIGKGCAILNTIYDFGREPWLIQIGNRVTITKGVMLLTHDGASRLFRDQLSGSSRYGNRFAPIIIHDECFIGVNSIIMPGVTIGPNSIVGVGSVVNQDVPPSTVVAGVPARHICSLEEYIERYQEKMIPIESDNRADLRRELTKRFWGEER